MRVVTRRTGLTPDVLRVWERRYGVVKPMRSEGGQRLYSAADLERLMTLSRLVRAGHRIAMIARLPDDELATLADDAGASADAAADDLAAAVVAKALDATASFDDEKLEQILRAAAMSFPASAWLERVLHPFLVAVGDRWHRGEISPAHEHLASATVRDALAWVLSSLEPASDAPVIIASTPAGELHEFGAMMASIVAAQAGWRVRYLGPNLPAEVLADCAQSMGAKVIALSMVHASENPILKEIRRLASLVDPGVSIVVGGKGAQARATSLAEIDVAVASDASALREHLDAIRDE
jgi:DNA-binding transcriptional MerR regulator/methylmalonyl-CoA mutase cobalamin-binding subunit